MTSRSSAAFASLLCFAAAACENPSPPGCPDGSVFLGGLCRTSCSQAGDCLNNESCDMALHACLPKIVAPLPVIRRFTATPSEFEQPGQEIMLSFDTTGATTFEITPFGASRSPGGSGTALVNVQDSTTFTLHAYNDDNVEVTADVQVTRIGGRPLIAELTATPGETRQGEDVVLSWRVINGEEAFIRLVQPNTMQVLGEGLAPAGMITDNIVEFPTTFTLEVVDTNGFLIRRSVTVFEVIDGPPGFTLFAANPPLIAPGDTALVLWQTQNARSLDLIENDVSYRSTNDRGEVSRGFEIVGPMEDSVYRGFATAEQLSAEDTTLVELDIPEPPSILQFEVSPEIRDANQTTVNVGWDVDTTTEVQLFENEMLAGVFRGSDRFFSAADTNLHYRLEARSEDGNVVQALQSSWRLVDEAELFPEPGNSTDEVTEVAVRASLGEIDEEDTFSIQVGEEGWVDARIASDMGGCDPTYPALLSFDLYDGELQNHIITAYDSNGCLRITKYGLKPGKYMFRVTAGLMLERIPYAIYAAWYPGVCGDAEHRSNEQCDDGNRLNGDGCNASCANEPPPVVEYEVTSPPGPLLLPGTVATYADLKVIGPNAGAADDGVAAVALPFPFKFFSNTYAGLWIHTNGMITLRPEDRARMPNGSLPSEERPNAVIAPFMADLRLADFEHENPGEIAYYELAGPAPGRRRFVVLFYNLTGKQHHAFDYVLLSATVVLEEETGVIGIQYGTATSRGDAGAFPFVAGIEDASGKLAAPVPGCDSTCTKDQVGGRLFVFTPRRN